jgi:hypothetical protein
VEAEKFVSDVGRRSLKAFHDRGEEIFTIIDSINRRKADKPLAKALKTT